ncbi:NUDIX domain-containing protein [Vibrio sp. SM6]|uniref:NUDIX domain-containing protein n=2 Tax=Vibrio agarilyticus TaxID=2726741 RepID=A0A7X8TQP8_9VIBR|nr:NUDIX domain-containing protein [Vibrio agarilyticus]
MKNIDKLAWLRIENKRVLCVRSHGKSLFYMPGGKREGAETDEQALRREISEELSVTLNDSSMVYYDQIAAQADGKPEGVMVVMRCYYADYTGELAENAEIAEAVWLSYEEIDKCSKALRILFEQLHHQGLI